MFLAKIVTTSRVVTVEIFFANKVANVTDPMKVFALNVYII